MTRAIQGLFLTIALLFLVGGAAGADSIDQFRAVTEFDATIRELATQDPNPSRLYLIEGTISSFEMFRNEDGTFEAQLFVIQAEWESEAKITKYTISLIVDTARLEPLFPQRIGRAEPGKLRNNGRVFALVQYLGETTAPDNTPVPAYLVHEMRLLL